MLFEQLGNRTRVERVTRHPVWVGLDVVRWLRRSSSNPFHHSSPRLSGVASQESSHLSSFRFWGRRRAGGRTAPDAVGLDCCLRKVGVFAMKFLIPDGSTNGF
jgi:hypothetical protein